MAWVTATPRILAGAARLGRGGGSTTTTLRRLHFNSNPAMRSTFPARSFPRSLGRCTSRVSPRSTKRGTFTCTLRMRRTRSWQRWNVKISLQLLEGLRPVRQRLRSRRRGRRHPRPVDRTTPRHRSALVGRPATDRGRPRRQPIRSDSRAGVPLMFQGAAAEAWACFRPLPSMGRRRTGTAAPRQWRHSGRVPAPAALGWRGTCPRKGTRSP
jgi:hypothetical protein